MTTLDTVLQVAVILSVRNVGKGTDDQKMGLLKRYPRLKPQFFMVKMSRVAIQKGMAGLIQ